VVCSGQLNPGYTAPASGNTLQISIGGETANCTFDPANPSTFTCSPINPGTTEGIKNVNASINGSNPIKAGEVEVKKEPISPSNLANAISGVVCNPTVTQPNTTINCEVTLNNGYTQPQGGKEFELNVQGENSVECTYNSTNNKFVCNNIPVGASQGVKNIQASIDGSTPQNTGTTVEVSNTSINGNNINNAIQTFSCDPNPVEINQTTACSGQLKPGYSAPQTGIFEIKINNEVGVCVFDPINIGNFECLPINVGPDEGIKDVLAIINGQQAPNKIGEVTVYSNQVNIISITPNQGPAVGGTRVTIRGNGFNSATEVYFFKDFANYFTGVNSQGFMDLPSPSSPIPPSSTCVDIVIVSPTELTCTTEMTTGEINYINAPEKAVTGIFDVVINVNQIDPNNQQKNILRNGFEFVLSELNSTHLQPGGLINGKTFAEATGLNCLDALAGTTTTCTGTLPKGYTSPTNGKLKLNVDGQSQVECTFTNPGASGASFTCVNMPVGNQTTTAGNLKDIQAAVDNLPLNDPGSNKVNTGEQININSNPIKPENLVNGGLINGKTFAEATNLQCNSSKGVNETIYVNETIICQGTLPEGYEGPTTGQLVLNVQGQTGAICTFTGRNFVCENIPAGNTPGEDLNIQASINGSTPVNTGETVDVEEIIPDPELVITEVHWAGTSASQGDKWIELKNVGSAPINLNDFVIKGIGIAARPDIKLSSNFGINFSSGTYNSSTKVFNNLNQFAGVCLNKVIQPGEYFLISASRNTFTDTLLNGVPDCFFNTQSNMGLGNGGAKIEIYSNQGVLLDEVDFR
jgi:hypothetical protein